MLNIIGLLKLENIIKRLTLEITKDTILNLKKDPIQPVMDIIHGSVMKYDIATTVVGLKAVTARTIEIIDSDGEKEISSRFCDHLERIGKLALSREDSESVTKVLESLKSFEKSTAEKRLKVAPSQAAQSWELLEKSLRKRDWRM